MNKPVVKLVGQDGNIFNLMGIASKELRKARQQEQADEMVNKITTEARSYDEALQIIMQYVEVE